MDSTDQGLEAFEAAKTFGRLRALEGVTIRFRPGEVHALLGENGAGKSTLMNLCSGFLRPDSGSILLDGQAIPYGRPADCRQAGIAMIHQHFTLAPLLTVEENLALPHLGGLAKGISAARVAAPMLAAAKRLGWELEPKALVRSLPVGAQQRIEILKNLSGSEKVLIFDEPTAPLAPSEVDDLLVAIRRLAEEGRVVVLIAHKLSEVMAAADRITVLRKGRVVGSMLRSEASPPVLAEMMVGEMPPSSAPSTVTAKEGGLKVSGLQVKGDRGELAVKGVTFDALRGSIFGIGGVDGNGQLELSEALAGIRRPSAGTVAFDCPNPQWAYIPADRRRDGLALGMKIWENLHLGEIHGHEFGLLYVKQAKARARELIDTYEIACSSENELAENLSGGNQQKVVVAREMSREPYATVAVNPTRGLDIRATQFVHNVLKRAAEQTPVVTVSANLDELAELTDRPWFMSRGQLTEGSDASSVVGGEE